MYLQPPRLISYTDITRQVDRESLSQPSDINYNWSAQSSDNYVPISHIRGIPPIVISIGDSVMESSFVQTTIIKASPSFKRFKGWLYKMSTLDSRITYQHMGYGSNYIYADVWGRFQRDVINRSPQFVVINGGINDYNAGVSTDHFIEAWTAVLDMSENAGIIPVIWSIAPDERHDAIKSRGRCLEYITRSTRGNF